jgi:hypothetical protein
VAHSPARDEHSARAKRTCRKLFLARDKDSFARAAQSFHPLFHSVARASRASNLPPNFPPPTQKTVDSIFSNY